MKKLILTLCIVSSLMQANEKLIEENESWRLIALIDDFSDKVTCHMLSKISSDDDLASLVIQNINTNDSKIRMLAGKFIGKEITYRVDKNESKILKKFIINNKEYKEMIEALKKGEILKIKVVPENSYANTEQNTIFLKDFEKLYNLAKTCNYK